MGDRHDIGNAECSKMSSTAANKGTKTERKPSESSEKLEEIYQNVPDGFENLTFANFGGSGGSDQTEKTGTKLKPRRTKEDLDAIYARIPSDVQVELTFTHLGIGQIEVSEGTNSSSLSSSLDFSKALQAVQPRQRPGNVENTTEGNYIPKSSKTRYVPESPHPSNRSVNIHKNGIISNGKISSSPTSMDSSRRISSPSASVDDFSRMSLRSEAPGQEKGLKKRTGIPHSNICSLCNCYVFVFRHRCLVCGRVYCRQCVDFGMGDMKEGRKCTSCVGHRFSERYLTRAGQTGCLGLPNAVKTAELKWAELGPRKPRQGALTTPLQARTPIAGSSLSGTPSRGISSVQGIRMRSRPPTSSI